MIKVNYIFVVLSLSVILSSCSIEKSAEAEPSSKIAVLVLYSDNRYKSPLE